MINWTGEIAPKIFSIITVLELEAGLENKIGVSVSLVVSLARLLLNSRCDVAVLEHLNLESDGRVGPVRSQEAILGARHSSYKQFA